MVTPAPYPLGSAFVWNVNVSRLELPGGISRLPLRHPESIVVGGMLSWASQILAPSKETSSSFWLEGGQLR